MKMHVHRIARRARLVVDYHAILFEQLVDQRRLSDVGLSHDGDPYGFCGRLGLGLLRDAFGYEIEQISDADAV